MNVSPCEIGKWSVLGGNTLETIPEIPAIRPFVAINSTAERPMSAPPNREAIGVKSVSMSGPFADVVWVYLSALVGVCNKLNMRSVNGACALHNACTTYAQPMHGAARAPLGRCIVNL